jgi:hypothetical protein
VIRAIRSAGYGDCIRRGASGSIREAMTQKDRNESRRRTTNAPASRRVR